MYRSVNVLSKAQAKKPALLASSLLLVHLLLFRTVASLGHNLGCGFCWGGGREGAVLLGLGAWKSLGRPALVGEGELALPTFFCHVTLALP